jgi:glc operon protein GlcG
MPLTLTEANQIIDSALNKARELDVRVSAAVCDAGGRLIAFARMDGATWAGVYGAQGKAIASAATGAPSGRIPSDLHVMVKIAEHDGGHMIYAQGAVPIVRNGVIEGAIGVGGAMSSQQDEECAVAGAAAIKPNN